MWQGTWHHACALLAYKEACLEWLEYLLLYSTLFRSVLCVSKSSLEIYQTEHLSRKFCSRSNLEEFRGRDGSLERGRITEENSAALTITGLPYFIGSGSSTNTLSKWV